MGGELLEFVLALDEYKRMNNRPFPSWSEVFEVIQYLGYRKVATQGEHIDRPTQDAEEDCSDDMAELDELESED